MTSTSHTHKIKVVADKGTIPQGSFDSNRWKAFCGNFHFKEVGLQDSFGKLSKKGQALHPNKVDSLRRSRKGKPYAGQRKEAARFKEELLSDQRLIAQGISDQGDGLNSEPAIYDLVDDLEEANE